MVRSAPWADALGRRIYERLPQSWHDNPTNRARAFFAGEPCVAFMQIGAYDGVAGDPLRPLVLANPRWTGVLVEPQADAFARLERNYLREKAHLTLLNAAISDRSGERALHYIPQNERQRLGLPDWSGEIASFDAQHLRKHLPTASLSQTSVRTMTFAEAARQLPDERVDLVAIDVEGHEGVIVPAIDFDRHRVRFLIYEHKHLAADDQRRIDALFLRHRFTQKRFGRDAIAWRRLD